MESSESPSGFSLLVKARARIHSGLTAEKEFMTIRYRVFTATLLAAVLGALIELV